MTRMERRRRRRRILRIKLATTAAVLALTTASIVSLTGGQPKRCPNKHRSRPRCRLSRFCWLQSTTVHISPSR